MNDFVDMTWVTLWHCFLWRSMTCNRDFKTSEEQVPRPRSPAPDQLGCFFPPNPPSVYCAKPDLGSTWRNDSTAKLKKKKRCTPWNKPSPLKIGHPKRKLVFQPSSFRCELEWTVSFPEGNQLSFIPSPFPSRSTFFFCPSAFCGEAQGDEVSPLGHEIVWPGTMKVTMNFFSFPNVPIHGAGK